jgi:hypothetical protein
MAHKRKGFEITLIRRRRIDDLAKKVGCPLNWNRAPGVQWNGKSVACKDQDASNIVHDIAHYAVATKKARKSLDYGLGAGPDTKHGSYTYDAMDPIYTYDECRAIERKASALGIYWERMLKLPWKDTLAYHNWDSLAEIKKDWRKLSRHINKVGVIK